MTESPRSLPPSVSFVLTRHATCSLLALVMLTAFIWLPMMFVSVPLLAVLLSFIAVIINMLTPALFALIFIGGGKRYALQVGGLVTLLVVVFSGFDVLLGLFVGLFYSLLPVLAAEHLKRIGGIDRSAIQLLVVMVVAMSVGLLMGAQSQGVDVKAWVNQLLEPMFSGMQMQVNVSEQSMKETREVLVWMLPGFMAFSLWLTWWSDVLLARKLAVQYGFYTGDMADMLQLSVGKVLAYAFMLSLIIANATSGSVQYLAVVLALILAGVLAVQGVAVAHVWLKVRNMQMMIAMMYILLFIWFMMVIPFIVLGMLDIWFDFRRRINPTVGGK